MKHLVIRNTSQEAIEQLIELLKSAASIRVDLIDAEQREFTIDSLVNVVRDQVVVVELRHYD